MLLCLIDLSKSCRRIQARKTLTYRLKNPLTEAVRIIKKGTKRKRIVDDVSSRIVYDSVSSCIQTSITGGLYPVLLPLAIERLYHASSLREDTVQESNAMNIYEYFLF